MRVSSRGEGMGEFASRLEMPLREHPHTLGTSDSLAIANKNAGFRRRFCIDA